MIPIRPAATVLLLREGDRGIEVLVLRRLARLRMLGGAWVFPGGTVDAADAVPELLAQIPPEERARCARRVGLAEDEAVALHVAACRETFEECGVRLERDGRPDIGSLRLWSRWITPAGVPRRFDTCFFATAMPRGQSVRANAESSEVAWIAPDEVLDLVAPPTQHTLADLADAYARHGSLDRLLVAEAARPAPPILPKLVEEGGTRVVCFPWDPAYPEIPGEGIELRSVPPHLARLPSRATPSERLRNRP